LALGSTSPDTGAVAIPGSYPARVGTALQALVQSLLPLAPEPQALVVYGSLARGRFREGESDVNLVVVLGDDSPRVLAALREPLRAAYRTARVEPFVIRFAELPRLIESFPIKLFDIQRHHHVLHGTDPFASLEIRWPDMRRGAEQELQNHALRLRRAWLLWGDDVPSLARVLYRSAASLAVELEAMLWLKQRFPVNAEPQIVFDTAADEFALDRDTLRALWHLKCGTASARVDELFTRVLGTVEQAAVAAESLEPPR
jgi:predicted nucleotidyltransferase